MFLQHLPIRRKLLVVMLLISGLALLMTGAAFVTYEWVTSRRLMVRDLSTLSQITAENASASLAFDNTKDATNVLSALRFEKQILAAALYRNNGKIFATHPPGLSESEFPQSVRSSGAHFSADSIEFFQPVLQDNERFGTLYLKAGQAELFSRIRLYSLLVVIGLIVSLLFALLLASGLQKTISGPVLSLASAARRISEKKDYSIRVPAAGSRDEIGLLTDAFNSMLDQIRVRDEALRENEERLTLTLKSAGVGTWSYQIPDNRLLWDDFVPPLFGLQTQARPSNYEEFLGLIQPDDRPRVQKALEQTLALNAFYEVEFQVSWPDGSLHDLASRGKLYRNSEGKPVLILGVCMDVTERKLAERNLKSAVAELERSNKELEQFAYVASHDLQEPLRMVSSYTQLLARRYANRLDADANDFIGFAVDGAKRMQQLIEDLLEFSRVGTRGRAFEAVDSNVPLNQALENLHLRLQETGAIVQRGELPAIWADAPQLVQLFQNLISNAIKFRNPAVPVIKINAREHPGEWVFSVEDNGIGIAPEYFERIFVIFQRVHARAEYPGTGIGLAICKRIVERHGGRIWVESQPGIGSTFYFTIPKNRIVQKKS